ncbi:MAG: hypothetical protein CVU56_24430 [Deltaproteobacteria bacterium HGW-Deltaproteobacteria-14]|jgi:hypothetical protein|nr:MAG: hypothetical protein CVU56_24430 [Deltaproteobacteria bacterium HGW-Deltaproteobacteria-14]
MKPTIATLRRSSFLALLALPIAGCLDSGTGKTDPNAAFRGTIRVSVAPLNLQGVAEGLIDVGVGPASAADAGWTRVRVSWVPEDGPAELIAPCDVRDNPYSVTTDVIGVYADRLADVGDFGGAAPPEALPFQDPIIEPRRVDCVAGQETFAAFDIALMKPAEQGFLETGVTLDAGEVVRDAVWDLEVLDDATPRASIWKQRVSSARYGDGHGTFSYVGPCSAETGTTTDGLVTTRLVGLYAASLTTEVWDSNAVGSYGDDPPVGVLEGWPVPPIARVFDCVLNQDVALYLQATLAQPVRADRGTAARFAGAACEAAWACDAGDAGAALTLSCAAPGEAAPALYLDDLVLRCAGREDMRLDPTATAELEEQVGDGVATATWQVWPELDMAALSNGACTLVARGTAATPQEDPHAVTVVDGVIGAGDIYPLLTWRIPVSDEAGPICAPAALDLTGPVTVTYTSTGAAEAVALPYGSR